MITLEQVQLLETRVAKAIEYVQHVSEENAALISEKAGLLNKLEANQKRLDELELLVMRFKKEQGQIEDGIVAALDRLNRFEEEFEESLKEKEVPKKSAPVKKAEQTAEPVSRQLPEQKSVSGGSHPAEKVSAPVKKPADANPKAQSNSKEFFEITETEDQELPEDSSHDGIEIVDIEKELSSDFSDEEPDEDSGDRELDIF